MTTDELNEFLAAEFPQVRNDFLVEEVRPMGVRVRLKVEDKHLRPGGTVSGPTMFALADVAVYLGVLGMIGPKGLAVTTNCSMDFMRKPAAATDLVADCTILKLGRVLAVGDVMIRSDGQEAPVARATMTYSIPPERTPQG
ncbi:PaaI family thioesterase [Pseudooceanicola nitratireducens]|nr:PaaI family thioesterase [Pseudooceanicola nitratireducens]